MAKQVKRKAEVVIEYTAEDEGRPEIIRNDTPEKIQEPTRDLLVFKPTIKMKSAKVNFHKNCPDKLISTLDAKLPVTSFVFEDTAIPIVEYMKRVSVFEFDEWVRIPDFWEWFISSSEDKQDVLKDELSLRSYEKLGELLDLESVNEVGEVNEKVASLQMRAIELIIGKKANTGTTINKTINNNLKIKGIPKAMAKLPESTLRRDLKHLQALNAPAKRGRKKRNEL